MDFQGKSNLSICTSYILENTFFSFFAVTGNHCELQEHVMRIPGRFLAIYAVENKKETIPWLCKDDPCSQQMSVEISMGQCNNIKI